MEVRHCDYLPDIMKKAIRKHNELYDDNVTKVETDFYGTISIWINSFMWEKEIDIMKKLQIVLEVEIDEDAIKEIQIEEEDDIKTTDKYINEIIVQENDSKDSGAIMILNEDEEYYDMNIGSCRTMKNPKIISMTTIQ